MREGRLESVPTFLLLDKPDRRLFALSSRAFLLYFLKIKLALQAEW